MPPFHHDLRGRTGQPQNDFFATADQALFAANGGSINSWIAPAGGNVSEQLIRGERSRQGRRRPVHDDPLPTTDPDESAEVVRMLTAGAKEKPAVVQELVWGLLNSVEFRFNH